MKKNTLYGMAYAIALTAFTACSNAPILENDGSDSNTGKQGSAQKVAFSVEFKDYNTNEQEVTPFSFTHEAVQRDTVNLGNGLQAIATLTLNNDAPTAKTSTRVLPNDTYTMEAYEGYTHEFMGKISGKIENGKFISDDGRDEIPLDPGYYHFLLYNSKVRFEDDSLRIGRANSDDAYIGYVEEIVRSKPQHQKILFPLKRKGVRLRMKITGSAAFGVSTATLKNADAQGLPASLKYDLTGNKWSTATKSAFAQNITFPASKPGKLANTHFALSNEYTYLLNTTTADDLMITFNSGTIYGYNMAGKGLKFKKLVFATNGSYILNIDLVKK